MFTILKYILMFTIGLPFWAIWQFIKVLFSSSSKSSEKKKDRYMGMTDEEFDEFIEEQMDMDEEDEWE